MIDKYELMKTITYDEPFLYNGLSIYPVKMTKYMDFHMAINCLLLDKNSIPDIKILSMTYLEYLFYLYEDKQEPYLIMLGTLLRIVLHIENINLIRFDLDNKKILIGENIIDNDKLMDIKQIIFEQNCIEDIDENIQKEVRDDLAKAKELKMKQNNNKICSLEEQMICVLISSNLKLEDIYNLTIRKFSKILQRADYKLHYQIYMTASTSGIVEFKDKSMLKHWMSALDEVDNFADVKVDQKELEQKINLPTA